MSRVVHFEIAADQPERASKFYSDVFGWNISKWDAAGAEEYWLIKTGEEGTPGINGGMMKRMKPEMATVNTVDVPSVDEFVKKVTDSGGQIIMPKMAVTGVGHVAYCTDTEGNAFGIIEMDESAA